ncbi:hypothetical protein VTN02DRAFT_4745 [Thermoascus thermophilus]
MVFGLYLGAKLDICDFHDRILTFQYSNPFGYQPWREKRTFEAMFDILEADIVVFQETKIQRKDLQDNMVLVPGWDCYFSLPKAKKGYSGVVIYTRNATCAPIRAEEGVTGVLCPPNSSTSYRDLPEGRQVGGYPTAQQLSKCGVDAPMLDSEGRCVILEFPAFVLLGIYCPAIRDETRDTFRLGFMNALDARVRNLVAMGKRVFVTGDLNISKGEIDSAQAAEAIRRRITTEDEFISNPARRLLNHMLSDGKVIGERDEGRELPILHDICRSFHPDRRGMYTCWEQRTNARPGNYGSRIDYVLCSLDMKEWFSDSNIQEGLMGSDHCPVYAVLKESVPLNGVDVNIRDIMNPPGTFKNGQRVQEYSSKNFLPLSGRLIPEFCKRRNIKDMFLRKPSTSGKGTSPVLETPQNSGSVVKQNPSTAEERKCHLMNMPRNMVNVPERTAAENPMVCKRSPARETLAANQAKRRKAMTGAAIGTPGKGLQPVKAHKSLKGFFKPKQTKENGIDSVQNSKGDSQPTNLDVSESKPRACWEFQESPNVTTTEALQPNPSRMSASAEIGMSEMHNSTTARNDETAVDSIVSKKSWSRLLSKMAAPKCKGHQEPCISLITKKPGINRGRAFWICPRPLGPSGDKEKGTQWRCSTFIWASDWKPPGQ